MGTIFLSRISIDGVATAAFDGQSATARFGCRASSAGEGDLAGTATMTGEFVGNDHSEGPLGVLGTWSIAETAANGLDFTGAFGADLKP